MTSDVRSSERAGFSGETPPARFNLTAYAIGRSARATPDATALVVATNPDADNLETWSFAALEIEALKAGAVLIGLGLVPGDRILIQLPNTSLYAIAYFGAIAVGLIPIPASDQLTPPERDFLLRDSGSRAILTDRHITGRDGVEVINPERLKALIQAAEPASYSDTTAETPAYLVYTSGTTSQPKGVLHAHRAAWGRRPMYQGWYGLRSTDRVLHAGAFNWTYTLGTGLTDPWANGATALVYTGEKTPDLWPRLIRKLDATLFATVPGLYRQLLKYARSDLRALPTLRHGLMAGEQPPADLIPDWQALTGKSIYEALGMSEMSTFISTSPATPTRAGFAGRPQPGRRVEILPTELREDATANATPLPDGEEGLLAVHRSDPGMMLGYWHRPDAEREVFRGEWFVGGDLAVKDADGYVGHRGRADDVIKALGYRVSPMEVEAALLAHPAIGEVACTGVPVKDGVTVVGAFIVPASPEQTMPSDAELAAFAADRLAGYKCPRHWCVIDALPRTANGKLQRKALSA